MKLFVTSTKRKISPDGNREIKRLAKENGVMLWQIGELIGLKNDTAFSRFLRQELLPEERERIICAINDIRDGKTPPCRYCNVEPDGDIPANHDLLMDKTAPLVIDERKGGFSFNSNVPIRTILDVDGNHSALFVMTVNGKTDRDIYEGYVDINFCPMCGRKL